MSGLLLRIAITLLRAPVRAVMDEYFREASRRVRSKDRGVAVDGDVVTITDESGCVVRIHPKGAQR